MNDARFAHVLNRRMELIEDVLGQKALEYAAGGDRLSNFRRGAEIQRVPMEQVCWNFLMKHLISIQDLVESRRAYDRKVWDEKLGDAINYLILLEAITHETTPEAQRWVPQPQEGTE